MAGTLITQNIQGPSTGANANKILIPNGQTLAAYGYIVQTVSSGAFTSSVTLSSSSFTATGHTVTITPKLDNSNILVTLSGGGWYDNGYSSIATYISFYRSVSGGAYSVLSGIDATYGLIRMSGDGNTWNIKPYSAQWLDSTSASSGTSIIYQVYGRTTINSAMYNHSDRGTPVLIAQEIAQ